MTHRWAATFGILGVLLFVIAVVAGGWLFPGYSHISQLISESYAVDAPYGEPLRCYLYIPSGILIFLFAVLAIISLPKSVGSFLGFCGIGIFYGLATVVVALFPCDAGCNKEFINPTLSQFIHNIVGVVTYAVVPFSLIVLAFVARYWPHPNTISRWSLGCGMVAFAFVVVLFFHADSAFAGLFQRIVESSILLWLLMCSRYLLQRIE